MAYGNSGSSNNNQRKGNYGSNNSSNARPAAAQGQARGDREEPILAKFMRATKSGKSIAFLTGEKALTIPANTRVVVTPLTEKRMAALEKTAKERNFKGSVPTHELVVFPVEIKSAN